LASSRQLAGAVVSALAGIILLSLPATAEAVAGFDAASASVSRTPSPRLAWTHTLGSGPNRILIVAVTIEDLGWCEPVVRVTFGGEPMLPVPGGVARVDDTHSFFWFPWPRHILQTQLFYLLDAELPPAGAHRVAVWLRQPALGIGGGAISLFGLAQAPPESVAVAAAADRAASISAAITTLTPRAWIVDAVGSDIGRALSPAGGEQSLRYAEATHGRLSVAGGAALALEAGPRTLAWDLAGAGRLTQVAAAFAPILFPLSTTVDGQGMVEPSGGLFPDGSTVELRAIPKPGWVFVGWSGDASGAQNPLPLLIDGSKTITATFTPDFSLSGWATSNGGTTGGEGGPEVVVDTLAALRYYADQPGPYVIKVAGTIFGDETVRVRSDKSILGIGPDARLLGVGLQIGWNSEFGQIGNVVIRNITFEKAHAPIDGVFVSYGARNVWIDHCSFLSDRDHGVDFYDGLVDITNGADFVTVSWSRFSNHYKTSLVGAGDNTADLDAGHLTITYHHNSFINSGGRNPSVRFGLVHVFNNYYRDLDDYGIASRMNAEVVIENNWFENVNRPIRADTSLSPVAGLVRGTDTNVYVNSAGNSITGPEATWVPPYVYAPDPVSIVPDTVTRWAGVGIVTFEGQPPPPTAPTITRRPASQTVEVGQSVAFSVLADGTYPFAYQWYKDGTLIDAATSPTFELVSAQEGDAGDYTVEVSNVAGSVMSDPAVLIVRTSSGGGEGVFLHERFTDGERNTQSLPDSAAWFTSSGSSNLVVVGNELRQAASSSRTLLTYFTDDQGQPVTLAEGERLTLRFTFRFSAFDPGSDNFRVALLRAIANPDATSGTGFVPTGPPNTNARVSGDFGSNGPTSNVFSLYSGYAAFTTVRDASVATPIRFYARTASSATLLGSTAAYTQVTGASPAASEPMQAGTMYQGTLTLTRTASGISLAYSVTRIGDGAVMMSYTAEQGGATSTAFDTAAFYLGRSSVTFDFFLAEADIERVVP
jgi:pectate lyase